MSVGLMGNAIVTGLEVDSDGSLRVGIAGNAANLHTHVDDADSIDRLRKAWGGGGHVFTTVPRESLCTCGRECDYCHGEGVRTIREDGVETTVTCGRCNGTGFA